MNTINTEVLVVGSGFGAAAQALRLSQAGCKVLIIEKGKSIVPQKDFELTQDPKYLLQYLKGISSDQVSFGYAEGLGGGSGFYEMVSLRAPSKVFDQIDADGHRLWPAGVDRKVLDPYYDLAEEMLHVEQIAVDEIPKSGVAFSLLMKNLGYTCDRAKYAVKGCVGSGYCVTGCIFGAKQSLHLNYLPKARQVGTEILTDLEAVSIQPLLSDVRSTLPNRNLATLPYTYEVRCRSLNDKEDITIQAKLVILGGGTVGTAKVLLNSRENMRFLSRHVGDNIAFNGSVKAAGLLPEGFIEGDMLSGRSHPGMISYHFFDSLGITISSAKPLPLQVVATARLVLDGEDRNPSYWGKANVELMKLYRRRMVVLYALGLTPPQARIRQVGRNDFEPQLDTLLHSILRRNGCKIIKTDQIDGEGKPYEDIHFGTTHMIGSCRMADQKGNGVADAFGEVFDYPHLFVTDGAAIPTSLAVNSSLTILANAERIASYLARSYGRTEREKIVVRVDGEPSVPQRVN
jgi:choline dehydrogenase-like flavoprotein